MSRCKHDDHTINYNGGGRSARIDAVGRSAIKLCDLGKVISCPWATVTGREGVVTLEVTFNDYHLEHWGSRREGSCGAGGTQALWVVESPMGQCRQ